MIQAIFGLLFMLVIGLVFAFQTGEEGVATSGRNLGQKTSDQITSISADPKRGTVEIPALSHSKDKEIDIVK
ncbi:hypothetical protein [Brevibacillus massiliensis]|uniref:hypothetical protein n=1 Tax=Brevibacillus massiliensis TaxID=1118054 RepID=UPI0003055151|nr:hypothetical protein [Brevibacillus massiliensis]